jgi:hypothetical protein
MKTLPGDHEVGTRPNCTSSRAAPIADLVLAIASAGGAIALLSGGVDCEKRDGGESPATCIGRGLGGAALMVGAVVYALSSRSGFGEARRCRAAQQRFGGDVEPMNSQ